MQRKSRVKLVRILFFLNLLKKSLKKIKRAQKKEKEIKVLSNNQVNHYLQQKNQSRSLVMLNNKYLLLLLMLMRLQVLLYKRSNHPQLMNQYWNKLFKETSLWNLTLTIQKRITFIRLFLITNLKKTCSKLLVLNNFRDQITNKRILAMIQI